MIRFRVRGGIGLEKPPSNAYIDFVESMGESFGMGLCPPEVRRPAQELMRRDRTVVADKPRADMLLSWLRSLGGWRDRPASVVARYEP
jgi:hypothetical protein